MLILAGGMGCSKGDGQVSLSRVQQEERVPDVPVPAADGPKLGATAHALPVRRVPGRKATIIGYLHAGARVARAEKPYSDEDCEGGWYPIRPRGFVCLEEGASLDPRHPTLTTMAIQPNLEAPMPYTYARTLKDETLLEVDADAERQVTANGKLPSRSGLAVVGSWEAAEAGGDKRRLAMLTNGQFVNAEQLEEASYSDFHGVVVGKDTLLPTAFVVKRGVFEWALLGPKLDRKSQLTFHQRLDLTGRYRTLHKRKFWELTNGNWVRHRDVTAIASRASKFPTFATGKRRWVDVSVVMGTLIAYEGKSPIYATLVSVGKDRLGDGMDKPRITERGEFEIVAKHVTALNAKVRGFANRVDIYDAPWMMELASGQMVHGAYWHNRFGVEHGPGNLQLSPGDARWLWHWAGPEVPEGWHAVTDAGNSEERTIVNIRR